MSAEPPSSSGLPGRSRPSLSDLSKETTEGDLWNLDDELPSVPRRQPTPAPMGPVPKKEGTEPSDPPVAETSPQPRGKTPSQTHQKPLAPRSERAVPIDEIGDLEELRARVEDDVVVIIAPDETEELEDPVIMPARPDPPEETAAEPGMEIPAPLPKENKPRAEAAPKAPAGARLPRPRLNRRELLGLSAFSFVLLLAALWILVHFFSQLRFKSEFVKPPDFPVTGEHASLAAADTFWREPVRDGDARDVARREVIMIPVLEISLDPENSPGGALRVIFRGSEGEPVGDPITRTFSAGRFDASGNADITFPATDGFLDEGSFNAYRTGKGEPWMAEVLEGPSIDAPASSFKKLAPIPVLPLRR